MLDNGNRKIFIEKYGLKDTDACIFIEKLRNRFAQQKREYKAPNGKIFTNSYYNIFDETTNTYKTLDHFNKFYSQKHKCYIITAQPYWFPENLEELKQLWGAVNLSFTILNRFSWHSPSSCTLYAIGTTDNLIKIFEKVDFNGEF